MPKRNIVKIYGEDQYYHVYNRGVNKQDIFKDEQDNAYFLGLLKRHLSSEPVIDRFGREYINYSEQVELVAYCLMSNHVHALLYLKEKTGITTLMRSVMTAYSMYFNKKYERTGKLFEGAFLASLITTDVYLWHVSRYIHLNPIDKGTDFQTYPYSSLAYFLGEKRADWLHPERLIETPSEQTQYRDFVTDYKEMHKERKLLTNILACE